MDRRSARYEYQILRDGTNSGSRLFRLITQGSSVLDIGCSTGFLGQALQEKNCRCIGIEIDSEAAETARAYYEKVLVGDVLWALPGLGNQQFDFIVLGDILEHLTNPVELLKKLDPFLTKDGELLVSLPNITHISMTCELLKGRFHYRDTGLLDFTHLRFFDRSSALELLQEAGYSGIIVDTVTKDPSDTEFMTNLAEFPPDTIALLNSNPDARVYQFIIRAVPSGRFHALATVEVLRRELADADNAVNAKSVEIDVLRRQLADADNAVNAKSVEIDTFRRQLADADNAVNVKSVEIDALRRQLADADSAVNAKAAEIDALHSDLNAAEVVGKRQAFELETCRAEMDRMHRTRWRRIADGLSRIKRHPRKVIVQYSQYVYWFLTFQLGKRIKEKRAFEQIAQSGLFDSSFYLESNPDVASAGLDPLVHYLTWGAAEGRNPSPLFDTSFYLESNPDVARAGVNPLVHYLTRGAAEGRDPNPLFDTSHYLESNPGVARAGINPLVHFMAWGACECRDPATSAGIPSVSLTLKSLETKYSSYPTRIPVASLTAEGLVRTLMEAMPQSRFVVALSHDNYATVVGGVQIFVSDEQRICNENQIGYLHFFPTNPRPMLARPEETFYVSINCNGRLVAECQADLALESIKQLLQGTTRKTLSNIILHQLLGFNINWVRRLVDETGNGKALFWVHDFFALCPCYTLMRNDIAYCDAPPAGSSSCRICTYGDERPRHLQSFHDLFNHLDLTVVAPSHYVQRIWKEKADFRSSEVRVMPHCHIKWEETRRPTNAQPQSPLRIGFLGLPYHHKGWTTWKQIVQRFGSDSRYRFFHFSTIEDHSPLLTYIPVSVSPKNRQAMTDALRMHRIDVAFLWSVWPEPFCFTLHEAMAAGCYVITHPNSGNVQATVLQTSCGSVLAGEEEAAAWFESGHLIEEVRKFQSQKARFGSLVFGPGSYKIIFETSEEVGD